MPGDDRKLYAERRAVCTGESVDRAFNEICALPKNARLIPDASPGQAAFEHALIAKAGYGLPSTSPDGKQHPFGALTITPRQDELVVRMTEMAIREFNVALMPAVYDLGDMEVQGEPGLRAEISYQSVRLHRLGSQKVW